MAGDFQYQAFVEDYSRIEPVLRSQVERITHNRHVVEDILQEAMLRGLKQSAIEHIRSPEAWLRRVTYNLAVDYFRSKKPKPLGELSSRIREVSAPDKAGQYAPDLGIEQMVQSLPSHYAKILVLRYRDGLGYNEISERLQIPAGSAKNMACRARSQLRSRFEKEKYRS